MSWGVRVPVLAALLLAAGALSFGCGQEATVTQAPSGQTADTREAASPATAPRERQARPGPRSRRPPRRAGRASCRSLHQVDGPTAPPTHRTSRP